MEKKQIIIFVTIIALILVGIGFLATKAETGPDLTAFAGCLKDKGAIFYGAWWCPHCANTKKLFGKARNAIPYVECSASDPKIQLKQCTDKGVTSYPTWRFADGSELKGELTLQQLADKTSCVLPTAEPAS